MELEVLKKKLSTFRTDKGRLTKVSDDLLVEILVAWEQWTGPAKGFYSALGADHRKMASLIGRAKRLKREGFFPEESFKEIKISDFVSQGPTSTLQGGIIELALDQSKLIRFSGVPQLIEFLIQYPRVWPESPSQQHLEIKKAG